MSRIRILVVDDVAIIRRLLSEELGKDPALEVVGSAPNGKIALAKLPQLNPDLVILDIEMPEMDGLEALKELRKTYRRLPVIMFSTLTERGATATLDALTLGATAYFTKPSNTTGLEASLEIIRRQLIPEIKAICAQVKERDQSPAPSPLAPSSQPGVPLTPGSRGGAPVAFAPRPKTVVDVVAIGASTGGPTALAELLPLLPVDFPVPIVIVQHMPPMFTRLLAERLAAQSSIRVREGVSGAPLEPGLAWIAPGDQHMIVTRDGAQRRLLLHADPPENSCRPAVDPLFRSVATAFGGNALAVVLTGMGQDGLRGCQTLRGVGAQIVAQDEASSVVWGMPGAVVKAGLADRVLPLALLANEMIQRVRNRR